MIPYTDIQKWAENRWPEVLKAELLGEAFFPRTVNKKRFPKDMPTGEQFAILEEVRNRAKQWQSSTETTVKRGFGYTYHFAEKGAAAKNREARLLEFETLEDYLKFVDREAEFATFKKRCETLATKFPQLSDWLLKHPLKVIEFEPLWDRLQLVLQFFIDHPRPNLYLRELQLPVDTKFIERNVSLLNVLLELVLPDEAVDSTETVFEKKYGLNWVEPLIRICFLDPKLQQTCNERDSDFGLPVRTLAARTDWPIAKVIVIENLTTLLSLRDQGYDHFLGLHGHGYRVTNFADLHWLNDCELYYWGDIDSQGFEILSLFRQRFPHTQSLFMDYATIEHASADIIGTGKPSQWRKQPELQAAEKEAYDWAREGWRQIEQEHLPMDWVRERLLRL